MSFVSTDILAAEAEEPAVQANTGLLRRIFDLLNEGCKRVLLAFYFEGKTMDEIASHANLGSAQAAKTKKLRCMKRLTNLIHTNGYKAEDFFL